MPPRPMAVTIHCRGMITATTGVSNDDDDDKIVVNENDDDGDGDYRC